jgi:outer membrane translocation and assembly module TamA
VGTNRLSAPSLRRLVDLHEGKRFDHARYLAAKERLRLMMLGKGFAHAKVDGTVAVDRDAHVANVELDLDPGPLARFGPTRITGNGDIPESAVRARLAWTVGERFDPKLVTLTEGRLYQLGVFSTVRVDYRHRGRLRDPPMTVTLAEGSHHEVRLGFGAGIDRSRWVVRLRAGYVEHSFLQPLLTLKVDARPGWAFVRSATAPQGFDGVVSVDLERQDFLAPRLRLDVLGAYVVEEAEAYASAGPEARVVIDHPFLLDRLLVGGGWTLRYASFTRLDDAITEQGPEFQSELGVNEPERVGTFDQSVAYDRRDHPLEPHSGFYGELRVQEAGPWAGGKFRYVKVVPEVRGYVPIGPRVTIAGKIRWGAFFGLGGPTDAPITERFFAGGATSNRGFPYRMLSPFVTASDGHSVPIGGEALLDSTIEARIDVMKVAQRWLGVTLFFDAGEVTMEQSQLSLSGIDCSVGGGVRYDTIVGAVRLDAGFRLNNTGPMDPDPGHSYAIHLMLGEAF